MESLTFVFTDIADSTATWEREPDAMRSAVARHDAITSDAIGQGGGRIYKALGDGVCAVFERPGDALEAARLVRREMSATSWPTAQPLRVRIAIAAGEAELRRGDYFGPAVNLVSRLLALCPGGHTLVAGDVASGRDARVERHGWYRFKGIERPVEVVELAGASEAIVSPPDGEKAYRVVRIDDRWRPLRDIPNNLTPERDLFIGRDAALRELADRLEGGARLVSVLGPGGIGKTRLVRHYAAEWLGEWPGGVYFCDLSEARSLEGIHFAVSMALGVPLGRGDAGEQLGHAIAGRGACLVVLDNFEQVQPLAPATVGGWLDQAAEAVFIVTSRERLHVRGESVFALEPLDTTRDAMALFEARAREQRPEFAVDDGNRADVAEIVRLLDGLPLAIELAAARVLVLSPAQIMERMHDRFALLANARGATARQATLKAAIDWSWTLLAEWEQSALAQCAVFEGGFTLGAAEAVLQLPAGAPPVIDVIQGLVDKSLLRARPLASQRLDIAEPYFGMYISIHEYASDRLRELGEPQPEDAERRHGRYYATFGADGAIDALMKHGGTLRRHRIAMELDNLVVACRRAMRRGEPETAAACFLAAFAVLEAQGPFTQAESLGHAVAQMGGLVGGQRSLVLAAVAHAMFASGRREPAHAALRDALAAAREAGDTRAEINALRGLAVTRHLIGMRDEAREHFDAALALCKDEDGPLRAILMSNLANLEMEQGRMAEAQASYHAALDLYRETGNRAAEGIALGNLGTLHHDLGQLDDARAAYEGALAMHRESGSLMQHAITLGNLGLLVKHQGDRVSAAGHYETALSIHRRIGNRRGVGVILKQMGELAFANGELGEAESRYEEALPIFRDIGHRRFEGGTLGDIGELMIARGRLPTALESIEEAERIFREIDDPLSLAELLAVKGLACAGLGDTATARAALREAEAIAARVGAKPDSDLMRKVARLHEALDA